MTLNFFMIFPPFILRSECIRANHPLAIFARIVYTVFFIVYYMRLQHINTSYLPEGAKEIDDMIVRRGTSDTVTVTFGISSHRPAVFQPHVRKEKSVELQLH